MKPLGQHRVGYGPPNDKATRARAERDAERHEHAAEVGNEIDDAPFCELCGGPCTGDDSFNWRGQVRSERQEK